MDQKKVTPEDVAKMPLGKRLRLIGLLAVVVAVAVPLIAIIVHAVVDLFTFTWQMW